VSGYLAADWPAPPTVRALTTTRQLPGCSEGPYARCNLGAASGDDPGRVAANRRALVAALGLPAEPVWLEQVHGTEVVELPGPGPYRADAAVTSEPGVVLAVLSADCLPVAFADRRGRRLGLAHAGWRGLLEGVLEATVAALARAPQDLIVWLGPAISVRAYEVGPELRARFLARDPGAERCFAAGHGDRWWCDLYALARARLERLGIEAIHGGGRCTHGERECFYSHRRDGARSGRQATLLWRS
jgi:YfiH family protein